MALVRRPAAPTLGAIVLAALVGCTGAGSEQAREENRKMDCLIRCGKELEREAARPVLVARSQAPDVQELPPVRLGNPAPMASNVPVPVPVPVPEGGARGSSEPNRAGEALPLPGVEPAVGIRAPDIVAPPVTPMTKPPIEAPPITPVAGTGPALPPPTPMVGRLEGDAQVRIVASVGNTPIYESEVREAVYQRMGELMRLPETQRQARERQMFGEELRKIIDRELVIDEMTAMLVKNKQAAGLARLKDAAAKEAEIRLKEFKKERNIPSDEIFREALQSQGLTMSGIRRQIERGFMMQAYLRERVNSHVEKIGLAEMREYYAAHPTEFTADDRVKWQDLFVAFDRFKTPDEARQYAAGLAARAARGADFEKLSAEYGMGDSKFRNGAGIGEKPGEIFPADLEPTVLALKQGQLTVKETEAGLHVLRVAERTYAGVRPYDEKVQAEVKRKLQNQIYERESRRLLDTLWKRTQPQIWVEG